MRVPGIRENQFVGTVTLLNVFASWCGPCRSEHPVLIKLSRLWSGFSMVGLATDTDDKVRAYLEDAGNPFDAVSIMQRPYSNVVGG